MLFKHNSYVEIPVKQTNMKFHLVNYNFFKSNTFQFYVLILPLIVPFTSKKLHTLLAIHVDSYNIHNYENMGQVIKIKYR